jgi:hypothetical protein
MKRTPLARVRFQRKPKRKKTGAKKPDERAAYRKRFPHDEWEEVLRFVTPGKIDPDDIRLDMPNECNHIFTAPRRHVVPCIITLSKFSHDWFHANILVGRMLCILVKLRKGEHDIDLWRKAYGKNVESLCDHEACKEPPYRAFRNEVLGRLRILELERRRKEAA